MRVQSNKTTAPAAKTAAAKPAAPAVKRDEAKMALDELSFGRPKPTAAQIADAKKTIAKLADAPSIPLKNAEKAAWIADAKTRLAGAEAALDVLRDAEWEKLLPAAELDAARDAVYDYADKIESAEVRAGIKPQPKPLNPFRPLFEYSKSIGNAPNNIFGALIASFGIIVAIPLDIADLVTRPIQAVMWPVAHAWNGIQKVGQKLGIG
jgi:hypothetical protein